MSILKEVLDKLGKNRRNKLLSNLSLSLKKLVNKKNGLRAFNLPTLKVLHQISATDAEQMVSVLLNGTVRRRMRVSAYNLGQLSRLVFFTLICCRN